MKNFLSKVPQIWYTLLLVFALSIPFSIKLNSALMLIILVLSLLHFFSRPEKKHLKENLYLLMFIVMYLLCLAGLLNSENIKPALFDFEQKIPLLALPLIFGAGVVLDERKKRQLQMAFVAGVLIICILNYRNGFYFVYSSASEIADANLLVRRPYLGMYCVFCIFFCLDFLRVNRDRWLRIVSLFIISFFCFFLVTLFAKMAFAVLAILSFIYLIILLFKNKKYLIAGIILTAIIAGLSYGAFFSDKGQEITKRAISFNEFDWANYDRMWVNSVNLRFLQWECTASALSDNKNWLWGAGTGDAQQLLDNCYTEKKGVDSFFVVEHYNPHNQYLTTWLNQGLIAILFLLFHFGFFLRHYFLTRNIIGCIFTIGIILFCITESIFEAQKGIVFYSFFQLLLYTTKDSPVAIDSPNHANPNIITKLHNK